MTTRDYTANVISASKVVPDGNFKDSKASGVWDINEALDLIKGGNWPNAANVNPSAFVDALFQTHLYTGNTTGTTATNQITTGIDLSNNDGLIWFKRRDGGETLSHHGLVDTLRGGTKELVSNSSAGQNTADSSQNVAFNSDGFTITGYYLYNALINYNDNNYVSWTFRKQPKFFDIVTYTGNGTSGRTVSHNLGTTVGMLIVKRTDGSGSWKVFHRSLADTESLSLNSNSDVGASSSFFNDTAPTSSVFTLGNSNDTNGNNLTYVAYLFAHNNDDGGFGEPGNQDIIKCGTYTGNAGNPQVIDVGFEPQFLMVKVASTSGDWQVVDNMRGVLPNGDYPCNNLYWNKRDSETLAGSFGFFANGFTAAQSSNTNGNGVKFVYMAIRRGGMQTPTAASDVFRTNVSDTDDSPKNNFTVGFAPDMSINTQTNGNQNFIVTRLLGNGSQKVNDATAFSTHSSSFFDGPTGTLNLNTNFWGAASNVVSWSWKRARGYFDVVPYTGTGSARTVSHNLGAVPEMIWVKGRNLDSQDWAVYHSATGTSKYLKLNEAIAAIGVGRITGTSDTTFTLDSDDIVNKSGDPYIAYLFATAAGVSKVGSFTQSGATNVDCGFTGDTPAFILLKRTDSTGSWYVFDSTRGIIAGNDPWLPLNTNAQQTTNEDIVDPYSGGFATTSTLTNGDYIFYAIAATS